MLDMLERPRRPARPVREAALTRLEARIRAIEGGPRWIGHPPGLDRPPEEPPGALPGVARGAVHEWFGLHDGAAGPASPWIPPMGVLMQLALRRLGEAPGVVVWIGRRLWPYLVPGGREGDAGLLKRSVFVDPPDEGSRLWAIDLAVRSAAVATVVADGSGLDLARTRRLQLAAESASALVLVARPPAERDRLSAAAVRWLVRPAPSADATPRWAVELLRCKGMQLQGGREEHSNQGQWPNQMPRQWMVEWKRVEGGLAVPAALRDRSRRAPLPGPAARKKTA